MVPQFLAASFEMLREGQEKMMKNFSDIPNPMAAMPGFEQMQKQQQAFLETMMGKWTPGSTMPESGDEGEAASEPEVSDLEDIKKQLESFRPKVPLIVALRKEGMSERHWSKISEGCGFDVKPGPGFNFKKILDLGLLDHLELCTTVGEK